MVRAYGNPPTKLYSWVRGRRPEALTMAKAIPMTFTAVAGVPVITGSDCRCRESIGVAMMGQGWIRPAQVELVAKAVLQACDKADGAEDLLVLDPVGCKAKFQPD